VEDVEGRETRAITEDTEAEGGSRMMRGMEDGDALAKPHGAWVGGRIPYIFKCPVHEARQVVGISAARNGQR